MTSTAVVGLPIAGRRPSTEIGDALGALKAAKDLLRNLIVLMGAMSNYMEDAVVKHFYRTGSFTKPTVLAVGLYTAAPGETGGGTEVTGGSYARAELDPLDANWAATSGSNGTTSNVADLSFPAPTANWGTIVAQGIHDATSAGNLMTYGSLTSSKTVNSGDAAPKFPAAALSNAFD
jgi:hypothetical protein